MLFPIYRFSIIAAVRIKRVVPLKVDNMSSGKKYSFTCISESRSVFFGIATLWITFFHSGNLSFEFLKFRPLIAALSFIRSYGNIGVEIFILLSGFGLYYSLANKKRVSQFYKKRLLRIIPAVFIVAVIWCGFILKITDPFAFFSKIFLLELFFNGDRDFWFFSFLIIIYALYPLVHRFISQKRTVLRIMVLLVCSILFNVFLFAADKDYFYLIEIASTRIPVFLIGVLFGYLSKSDYKSDLIPVLLISVFAGGFCFVPLVLTFSIIHERIFSSVIAISMVLFISWLSGAVSLRRTKKLLIGFGRYSLEIYLLYERVSIVLLRTIGFDKNFVCFYVISFTITVTLSALLQMIVESLLQNFGIVKKEPLKVEK